MTTYKRINNDAELEQSEKDRQPYKLVKAKVTKERHNFITFIDKTLKKCEYLLKNGDDLSKFRLSGEDLQELSEKQRKYYNNFSKKLDKLAANIKASQLQNRNFHEESDDSGIESGYESDCNSSALDTTPLIAQPNLKKTHFELHKSEEKTSRFKGISVKKIREKFTQFKKNVKKLAKRQSTIPLSYDNLNCDPDNTVHKVAEEQEKFKGLLESDADITINDEKDNNILHHIASLKEKQKCKFLDMLIEKISEANLEQLINSQNSDGKTPLQIALIAKIEKGKHKFDKPQEGDNTLQFIRRLIEFGANPNQLELSEEILKELSEEQKNYYHHFLEELKQSVKKSKPGQLITNQVTIKTAEIVEGGYPLHSAVRDGNKDKFNELLQSNYDITTQDVEGNTVLHYAIKLEKALRSNFTTLILEKNKELLNTKNNNELTPIYVLLEHIQKKSEDRSCTNRKFEETGRYQTLKLLLENGTDITSQDKDDNNILHCIASLKGEQKVTCLDLVLDLVKKRVISKDELSEAINIRNNEGYTPIQVALIKKAMKGKAEHLKPGAIFDLGITCDNTTKFCTMLLHAEANPDFLELQDEKFHTERYYLALRDLKDHKETPQIAQEKAKELKGKLEEKYGCKTFSNKTKCLSKTAIKKVRSGGKALWKCIDPARRTRELLVITATTTVITMAALAFFQGQIAIGAAIPIIAVAAVMCLIFTLGFNPINNFFKKLTANEQNTSNTENHARTTEISNNDQQDLGNHLAAQEPLGQEHPETPNTDISETRVDQFINRLLSKLAKG